MSDDDVSTDAGTQRIDKWLWFTRVVKSRTLAAGLVSDGKVRLNRARIDKPSQGIRVGDVVTATAHRKVHVLKVLALGARRGPPAEARMLYEDLSPPPPPVDPSAPVQVQVGRPNKRDRREIAALKRGQS
jgi:ribosome-associated heat shock protein Hsp15